MQMPAALDAFQLSPQQRRLWTVADGGGWNRGCLVEVEGDLDAGRLGRALRHLVERHEVLRTALPRLPGLALPVQVIGEPADPPLARLDLTGLDNGHQRARLDGLLDAERDAGFDLERPPLLRAVLARLAERRHALILTLPALIADARSLDNLVGDLDRAYGGLAPDDEPMQYADFAAWLSDLESSADGEAKSYWRQPAALARALALPFEPSAARPAHFPEALTWGLDATVAARLEAVAAAAGADLPALLLAAWAVLLWRVTGSRGPVIGQLCDGRRYEPLASAVGAYERYVPLRVETAAQVRFAELLQRTRDAMAENRARQEHFLWEESGEPQWFCPAAFFFEDLAASHRAGGLELRLVRHFGAGDRFTIELKGSRRGEDLALGLRYDPAQVDPGSVGLLGAQLTAVLGEIAERPEAVLGDLRGIGKATRHLISSELNDTHAPAPPPATLGERFAAQAERTPDATALCWEGGALTYAELDRRATRLARHLIRRGAGPGDLVGLCAERSAAMVVGLLSILKAGAAYLAIDPDQPPVRQALLLEDAMPRLLLLAGERARPSFGGEVVRLDPDGGFAAAGETGTAASSGSAESLAYLVYTSGSTGRPKGVLTPQPAVLNYLEYLTETQGLCSSDTVLQLAALSADASVRDLLAPLATGAAVALLEGAQAKDPQAIIRAIRDRGANRILSIVPTLLRAMVEAAAREGGMAGRLDSVLVSGERLYLEDCRRAREVFGEGLAIVNQYGPTECTMTSSYHLVPAVEGARGEALIGRPLRNVRCHLLDDRLEPVAPGAVGEIHIAGAGLAWGYLGRGDLSAERFLPDPFSGLPGSRLYRTGDLGRHLPTGELKFLGRRDTQVKIRGVRVEPGEVEAVLGRHPAVLQAVVVGRKDEGPGSTRLVAYVMPRAGAQVRPADLAASLRNELPEAMVPADFVALDSLPLTRTGKVDRGALPAPQRTELGAQAAPSNPIEVVLAGIWAELLGREHIGIDENFFALGGHSLLATQVMARLREVFPVELPLQAAFEAPTVAALAARVEAAMRCGLAVPPPLRAVPRDAPLALSFAQERHWFLHMLEPESPLFNTAGGLRLRGRLAIAALERSIAEILDRHEVLRTAFPAAAGNPVQVIVPALELQLPRVDLAGLPATKREDEALRVATVMALRPFDLSRPPLLRALLLRLGEEEHAVAVALHHIVFDAWSSVVFMRDLGAFYGAFLAGGPLPPPLPVQYADFAHWQRQWLQGEVLERLLSYWRSRLPAGGCAPQLFEQPSAFVSGPQAPGGRLPFGLAVAQVAALRGLAHSEGATLFMALLTGFKALLHLHSGECDIVVGAPVANRTLVATEGMIGCFVNALTLRTSLRGDPTFRELLLRLREGVLGAYTYQDLPFERLVEELNPNRKQNRWPLFHVVFNLLNAPIEPPALPGLETSFFDVDCGLPVKYDLGLYLVEQVGEVVGSLRYNPAVFEARTIAQMGERFQRLLAAWAEWPDRRLMEVGKALEEEERRREREERERWSASRRRDLAQVKRRTV